MSHSVESLSCGWRRNGKRITKTRSHKLSRNRTDETLHFFLIEEGTLRGTTEAKRSSGGAGKVREKRAGLGKKKRGVFCGEKLDFKKGDQLDENWGILCV